MVNCTLHRRARRPALHQHTAVLLPVLHDGAHHHDLPRHFRQMGNTAAAARLASRPGAPQLTQASGQAATSQTAAARPAGPTQRLRAQPADSAAAQQRAPSLQAALQQPPPRLQPAPRTRRRSTALRSQPARAIRSRQGLPQSRLLQRYRLSSTGWLADMRADSCSTPQPHTRGSCRHRPPCSPRLRRSPLHRHRTAPGRGARPHSSRRAARGRRVIARRATQTRSTEVPTHTTHAQPASVLPAAFGPAPSGTEQSAQQQLAAILSGLGKQTSKVKYATSPSSTRRWTTGPPTPCAPGGQSQQVESIRRYQRQLIHRFGRSERGAEGGAGVPPPVVQGGSRRHIDMFAPGAELNLAILHEVDPQPFDTRRTAAAPHAVARHAERQADGALPPAARAALQPRQQRRQAPSRLVHQPSHFHHAHHGRVQR